MRQDGKYAHAIGRAVESLRAPLAPWVLRFLTVLGQTAEKSKITVQS
jgi:hypothetical protein